ncbi:MAG: formyltransferase family protein, partial [Thermodesulfobacteriota bacterium]|nr:formyltransferase family protein [Thermodesulfobacteriota bacterium]
MNNTTLSRIRVVFLGTPEFAIPSLDALIQEGIEVSLVVTQPDRPKGRGRKLTPPPIKVFAQERGIAIVQKESITERSFIDQLRMLNPAFIVVVAFGKMISTELLYLPKFFCPTAEGTQQSLLSQTLMPSPSKRRRMASAFSLVPRDSLLR